MRASTEKCAARNDRRVQIFTHSVEELGFLLLPLFSFVGCEPIKRERSIGDVFMTRLALYLFDQFHVGNRAGNAKVSRA